MSRPRGNDAADSALPDCQNAGLKQPDIPDSIGAGWSALSFALLKEGEEGVVGVRKHSR
jgi:hypothetical protein